MSSMIGIFPQPYPDELLYSLYARYKKMMGYKKEGHVLYDLFGSNKVKISILWHDRLDLLLQNIPEGWCPSISDLIRNHTFVPVAAAFSGRKDQKDYLSVDFKGFQSDGYTKLLEDDRRLMGLAYCPECVREDYLKYGESYWRRSQNIYGVFVCPVHKLYLEYVYVPTKLRGVKLILPPSVDELPVGEEINLLQLNGRLMFYLAKDLSQLFSWFAVSNIKACLGKAIVKEIVYLGLDYNNLPSISKTKRVLEETFSNELLQALRFPLQTMRSRISWCEAFTSRVRHIMPVAIVIALYLVGKTATEVICKIGLTSGKCSKINEEVNRYVSLPVEVVMGEKVVAPISLSEEISKVVPVLPLLNRKGVRENVSFAKFPLFEISDVQRAEQVSEAIGFLKTQRRAITWRFISKYTCNSVETFKALLEKFPKLQKEVEETIETPLDFAKRKVQMAIESMRNKGLNPVTWDIVKETSTHKYYPLIKDYIEELLADKNSH